MNHEIIFTPATFSQAVLAVCAAIITIAGAFGVIKKLMKSLKSTDEVQNKKILKIEKDFNQFRADYFRDMSLVNQKLDRDNKRINRIEDGNMVIEDCMLGLLEFSISACQDQEVKKMLVKRKDTLQKFIMKHSRELSVDLLSDDRNSVNTVNNQ